MIGANGGSCPEDRTLLHALTDGELDAVHARQLERHLAECSRCTAEIAAIRGTSDVLSQEGLRWRAPEHVRVQILEALAREVRTGRAATGRHWARRVSEIAGRWGWIPSAAALAAALFLTLSAPTRDALLEQELVADHVRSLLVDHLTDVATSDQHTVKPWFGGKIDFSPPVVDLTTAGFPLVGGRVDYLAGRAAAAIVYRRRGHVINLFVWPDAVERRDLSGRDGYSVLAWRDGGLRFVAVSDVAETELARFRDAFLLETQGAKGPT
ncbi:MAG: anti-sigma factor [Methylobacteriaceae bacterium]|nr:anti-sigma factor [Methylobacteriaceae bacterium]